MYATYNYRTKKALKEDKAKFQQVLGQKFVIGKSGYQLDLSDNRTIIKHVSYWMLRQVRFVNGVSLSMLC